MRLYYSVQALYNLLSWPLIYRLADHSPSVSQATVGPSGEGQHYSDAPIFHDTGCKLFPSCLPYALSACTDDLGSRSLPTASKSCRIPTLRPKPRHRGR